MVRCNAVNETKTIIIGCEFFKSICHHMMKFSSKKYSPQLTWHNIYSQFNWFQNINAALCLHFIHTNDKPSEYEREEAGETLEDVFFLATNFIIFSLRSWENYLFLMLYNKYMCILVELSFCFVFNSLSEASSQLLSYMIFFNHIRRGMSFHFLAKLKMWF